MDQQHRSTVLAMEVQLKVAHMDKYKQESELTIQVTVPHPLFHWLVVLACQVPCAPAHGPHCIP